MRLADRHILAELLLFFFVSTIAVLALLVGMAVLFQHENIETLRVSLPYYLSLTLPVAIALAASLCVNRMARDNELTVLRGTGTSLLRAFLPILIVGAIVSGVDYYLFDRMLPEGLQKQASRVGFAQEPIAPGTAFAVDRYTITYSTSQRLSPSKRHLTSVIIIDMADKDGTPSQITTAGSADYENGVWTLNNAVFHRFTSSGATREERRAATARINLPVDFSSLYRRPDSAQAEYNFRELMDRARQAKRFGNQQDALAYEVDAWTKLALPAMAFVFTLFAGPLALRFAQTGSFSGVMLSIGTVFVAWNTLLLMQYIGYSGYLPPVVAAWATDVLFGVPGVILLCLADC